MDLEKTSREGPTIITCVDFPLEKAAALYRAGATLRDLAKLYYVSHSTIHRRLVEHGVTMR